jgi:hypothetical protein
VRRSVVPRVVPCDMVCMCMAVRVAHVLQRRQLVLVLMLVLVGGCIGEVDRAAAVEGAGAGTLVRVGARPLEGRFLVLDGVGVVDGASCTSSSTSRVGMAVAMVVRRMRGQGWVVMVAAAAPSHWYPVQVRGRTLCVLLCSVENSTNKEERRLTLLVTREVMYITR